jgi:hypothetical protein
MKTKYQPDFPERAKKMAEERLLDEQIASQLGISAVKRHGSGAYMNMAMPWKTSPRPAAHNRNATRKSVSRLS